MTDLYQILGVRRNAARATIQKAFRRLARKHHPDTGGTTEAFQRLQQAYHILSDDARRARYDATGQVEEAAPDNSHVQVMSILSTCFCTVLDQLLQTDRKPEHVDFVKLMDDALATHQRQERQAIQELTRARAIPASMVGRFTTEQAGENVLESLVRAQLQGLDQRIMQHTQQEALLGKSRDHLKVFRYIHEQPQAKKVVMPGELLWNNNVIRVLWDGGTATTADG